MTLQAVLVVLLAASSAGLFVHAKPSSFSPTSYRARRSANTKLRSRCTPPPIPIGFLGGAPANDTGLRKASKALEKIISSYNSDGGVDSIAMAVVTPSEVVHQQIIGVLRANDTSLGKPDADSLYRIASISKVFATLEMLILREKGVLNLDDPITRFLPNFTFPQGGWAKHLASDHTPGTKNDLARITLRQVASQMSGIGRDYPPAILDGYPHLTPNTTIGLNASTPWEILQAIATLPLIVDPYTYPVYSNNGFSLLGWTLVAAAKKTTSYADLIQQDIFNPMGLSSSFGVTGKNAKHVVVSSMPYEADWDLGEARNSAGGQYSSLRDLTTLIQMFLDPGNNPKSLLPSYVMREWARPLYVWDDGLTETGAPWEITKIRDSHGVPRRFYGKSGDLASYHSHITFEPTHASYGVVVLMAGTDGFPEEIAEQAITLFQPAFDAIIDRSVTRLYAGKWVSSDGKSMATTYALNGNIWLSQLTLNGTNAFQLFTDLGTTYLTDDSSLPLWSTGRKDEFRMALGSPVRGGDSEDSCTGGWVAMDLAYGLNTAPLDLILFEDHILEGRVMRVPSSGSVMRRKSTA